MILRKIWQKRNSSESFWHCSISYESWIQGSGLSKKSDSTISGSSHNLNIISIESKTPNVAALVDKTDLFSKVIKEKIPNSWGLLSKTNLSSGTNGVKDFSRTKLTWNKKGHYAKEYKL